MGQQQQDMDDLARMERICLDLAAGADMPEERAALEFMANCYRAEASCLQSCFPPASRWKFLGSNGTRRRCISYIKSLLDRSPVTTWPSLPVSCSAHLAQSINRYRIAIGNGTIRVTFADAAIRGVNFASRLTPRRSWGDRTEVRHRGGPRHRSAFVRVPLKGPLRRTREPPKGSSGSPIDLGAGNRTPHQPRLGRRVH
jgi:hypothetical protein